MIKQQTTTQERPVFGRVDPIMKKRRKVEKPVTQSQTPCAFQVLDIVGCNGKSKPCQNEALANGWCGQHQHARDGIDEGERLGYRSVEIPLVYYGEGREPFVLIIGQGKANWLAYFERATGSGLAKVMDYLSNL